MAVLEQTGQHLPKKNKPCSLCNLEGADLSRGEGIPLSCLSEPLTASIDTESPCLLRCRQGAWASGCPISHRCASHGGAKERSHCFIGWLCVSGVRTKLFQPLSCSNQNLTALSLAGGATHHPAIPRMGRCGSKGQHGDKHPLPPGQCHPALLAGQGAVAEVIN